MDVFFTFIVIGYCIGWLYVITHAILMLIPAIRCRKIENCKNDDCPFRFYCKHTAFSDAEKAAMRQNIDSLEE